MRVYVDVLILCNALVFRDEKELQPITGPLGNSALFQKWHFIFLAPLVPTALLRTQNCTVFCAFGPVVCARALSEVVLNF